MQGKSKSSFGLKLSHYNCLPDAAVKEKPWDMEATIAEENWKKACRIFAGGLCGIFNAQRI